MKRVGSTYFLFAFLHQGDFSSPLCGPDVATASIAHLTAGTRELGVASLKADETKMRSAPD